MNKIVHFEIPADNLARAQKFYEGLFGWKITNASMPGFEYLIAQTVKTDKNGRPLERGAINGGLQKKSNEAPAPMLVISVASIDEALRKIEGAGGALVTPKVPIGKMGFYARFKDSENNIMGLWEDVK